jgi:large conductance mechanosensitive channel
VKQHGHILCYKIGLMKGIYMSNDPSDQEGGAWGSVRKYSGRGLHAGLSTLGGFQKFILRGNVIDLAVGVVIGVAFNSVVQAIVKDLITPLIGLIGIPNMSNLQTTVNKNIFLFGDVINVIISFLITAAVVYFLVVKPMNALHDRYDRLKPKPEEAPTTRDCPYCLSTIPLGATRCAYCTAQLPPADGSTTPGGNFVPQR